MASVVKSYTLDGRKCGYLSYDPESGETVYVSRRSYKHLFRKYDAFGITLEILEDLKRMGVQRIYLWMKDGKSIGTTVRAFDNNAIVDKYDTDVQAFLPLEFWHVVHDIDAILPRNVKPRNTNRKYVHVS